MRIWRSSTCLFLSPQFVIKSTAPPSQPLILNAGKKKTLPAKREDVRMPSQIKKNMDHFALPPAEEKPINRSSSTVFISFGLTKNYQLSSRRDQTSRKPCDRSSFQNKRSASYLRPGNSCFLPVSELKCLQSEEKNNPAAGNRTQAIRLVPTGIKIIG